MSLDCASVTLTVTVLGMLRMYNNNDLMLSAFQIIINEIKAKFRPCESWYKNEYGVIKSHSLAESRIPKEDLLY